MLVVVSTDKSVSDAAAALQDAVQADHFCVMQVHNLKETMAKEGVEFERECLIFEVCQPQQAKKILGQNMSVSTALPCRNSIYEENIKAVLVTVKPTTLVGMLNAPQLEGVALEVEDAIVKIMKEAASARLAHGSSNANPRPVSQSSLADTLSRGQSGNMAEMPKAANKESAAGQRRHLTACPKISQEKGLL